MMEPYFKIPHDPTMAHRISEAMQKSVQEDWEEYWGWRALKLDTESVIEGDLFLEWLHARHPFKAGILAMQPWSFYTWHTDGRRGVSVNMLVDPRSGTHHSMFALPRDKSHSTGRFIELIYEPNTFYLFDNQIEHAVYNFEGHRFMFSLEFDEDKSALDFYTLKSEVSQPWLCLNSAGGGTNED